MDKASDSFKTAAAGRSYGWGMAPRFHFIGIFAADLAASLAFYRALGVDIPAEADQQPHVEATLPGGGLLAWDTVETARGLDPNWTTPSGSPRLALAFECDDPAAVDKTYADLVAAGYHGHLEPFDAVWGQRYAVVHDPDGNGVDLFAPRTS